MIRVVLADDQEDTRTGFRWSLEADPELVVVGEATNGVQAVETTRALEPDLVVMDVRMPILNGLSATEQILREGPTKVLVVTAYDLDEYAFRALDAGASGFLTKDLAAGELAAAAKAVACGDVMLTPRITKELLGRRYRFPLGAPRSSARGDPHASRGGLSCARCAGIDECRNC